MVFPFSKKKKRPNNLTDVDRELALDKRRQNAELRKMEFELEKQRLEMERLSLEADIQELQSNLAPEDTGMFGLGKEEMLLVNILTRGKGLNSVLSPSDTPADVQSESPMETQKTNLSDEQIKEYLKGIPKTMIKKARNLNDDILKGFILNARPDLDDDTINRAIVMVKQ